MNWQVVARPEAESAIEIAAWYDSRREGLGDRFVEEFLTLFDELAVTPLLHCRRHPPQARHLQTNGEHEVEYYRTLMRSAKIIFN